jgi:hypothetical protein
VVFTGPNTRSVVFRLRSYVVMGMELRLGLENEELAQLDKCVQATPLI